MNIKNIELGFYLDGSFITRIRLDCCICQGKSRLLSVWKKCNHCFCTPCSAQIIAAAGDSVPNCPLCREPMISTMDYAVPKSFIVKRKAKYWNPDYIKQALTVDTFSVYKNSKIVLAPTRSNKIYGKLIIKLQWV